MKGLLIGLPSLSLSEESLPSPPDTVPAVIKSVFETFVAPYQKNLDISMHYWRNLKMHK